MNNGRVSGNGGIEVRNPHAPVLSEPEIITAPIRELLGREGEWANARDYVSLATYWHILLKRRWTLLTTVLVLTILVTISSVRMTPIYRGTSRVQVEADTSQIQSLNDLYQRQTTDDAFLQTQIQLLKSETLAWQTIEQLRLGSNSNFINPKKLAKKDPEQQRFSLIAEFRSRLNVELVPKTRMLTVGVESPDPKLAAQISTSLVNNYIDYNFRLKYDATRQASGWMEQQLDELKAKVEKSQQLLVNYERQHAMANINAKDRQNVEEQMLSDLSKDLAVAQSDRIQKESLSNEARGNRDKVASLAHNELLQKLEETGAQLRGQHLESLAQYGPRFPKVVRLREQVDENQAQIEQERNRALERIHNDYTRALGRERLAEAAVARQKEHLGSYNQLAVQHNILQREFEANQQLYQNLMQRLKDATVSAGLRTTNIHLVDAALVPEKPVRPRILLNIAISVVAGLILGVIFAFAQEALDHSVKSAEELETRLGLPTLGIIPLQRTARQPAYGLRFRGVRVATLDPELGLEVANEPTSTFAEAYRSLRTAILLSLPEQPPRTLLVTSAMAGDGKTSTSLNLAAVLAQRKGPVVVVDCDLRKSGFAKVLKIDNQAGVSSILTGGHTLDEALQQSKTVPGLWVLPSGQTPPSPADLLSSDQMGELLEKLSDRFEHVVIDTPPVLAVTDSTILSRMVDGVVLVVACGRSSVAGLQRSRRTLDAAGARILGAILNKFDHRQQGYYYGYYYGRYDNKYGYRYGEQSTCPSSSSGISREELV